MIYCILWMDNYILNYKQQNVDSRDFKYNNVLHKDINTTKIFSLDKTKIKIYDQGKLGSCLSNAISGSIHYYNNTINPSRLYIYFNGRATSGNRSIMSDNGLTVRDGCKSVFDYHVCNEEEWVYDASSFFMMPSLNCYKNSFNFTNFIYYSINQDLDLIKSCLINGNPIIFGFIVYTSFMSVEVSKTGRVPMPSQQDNVVENTTDHKVLGGHSSVIIGFNDEEQVFQCVNSWGQKWGEGGFFYIPYQYVLDPSLAFDFTIINFNSTIPVVIPITTTKTKSNLKMQFI